MFLFKLALALGRHSADELGDELGSRAFAEWIAYDRISPIDIRERMEISNAIIAATVANTSRGPNQPAYELDNFLPKYGQQRQQQSVEQMAAIFSVFAHAHNASIKAG